MLLAIVLAISGCTSPTPTAAPTAVPNATVTPVPNATVTPAPSATPLPSKAPNFTTLTPGVLKIPVDTTFPPMEFINTSTTGQESFVGVDMDLMRDMCKLLNITPQFETRAWSTLLNDVTTGTYDCSISSWSIKPDRQQSVLFGEPYYVTHQTMVARVDDNRITNWSDIVALNLTVACQGGTTGYDVAAALTDKNGTPIKLTNILTFDGALDPFNELRKKTADVVIIDYAVNKYEVTQFPGEFKFVGEKWPYSESYAIITQKTNDQLMVALNWALDTMKVNGQYNATLKKWSLI